MNPKLIIVFAVVSFVPALAFGLGADSPEPGSERLKSELRANEEAQSPAGYAGLVDRAGLLGGYWVNSEDVFYYSGDKQSFEKFLADYARVTNVVAHTVITQQGPAMAGPPWSKSKSASYDWALYCHPYGWRENQRPMPNGEFVLWVELRVGGKITQQDSYDLKIPTGVQLLYVNQDSPPPDTTKSPKNAVEPTRAPAGVRGSP